MAEALSRPETTRIITQGVVRLFAAWNVASVLEAPLPNGRRADVVGIGVRGELWIAEVKSGPADFLSDAKWPDYGAFCDRFFFAIAPDFPQDLLPQGPGVIVADAFDGAFVRAAAPTSLAPARRKSMTLLLARLAAMRAITTDGA